jgi:hypothetical protein
MTQSHYKLAIFVGSLISFFLLLMSYLYGFLAHIDLDLDTDGY